MKHMPMATILLLLALVAAPTLAITAQGKPAEPGTLADAGDDLLFIENVGQFDPAARFQLRVAGNTIWFADGAIWITAPEQAPAAEATPASAGAGLIAGPTPVAPPGPRAAPRAANIRLSFAGTSRAQPPVPSGRQGVRLSYFTGNNPAAWHADVPVWRSIRYPDLYPGVDLEVSGGSDGWTWHLTGAVEQVRLVAEGAAAVKVAADGALRFETALGEVAGPTIDAGDARHPFRARLDGRQLSFEPAATAAVTGRPDAEGQASVDSALVLGTFLGGAGEDAAEAIALASDGGMVVTGYTLSTAFPVTPGVVDRSYNGGVDIFVAKLSATGNSLVFGTFLGGSYDDRAYGVALDAAGNMYITGSSMSGDYPTTPGAFDPTLNDSQDAIVTKLNPTGTALVYSTFLGGYDSMDAGYGIAVGANGNAVIVGSTDCGFPITAQAFDAVCANAEGFVTNLSPDGGSLVYSSYLGGYQPDIAWDVAVAADGTAFVTGLTKSPDFPTTPASFSPAFSGVHDAFIVRVNAAGSGLVYGALIGGSGDDQGTGVAIDHNGAAYVTGQTNSSNFLTTLGAYQRTLGGGFDGFVTKVSPDGGALGYSTYLGGSSNDCEVGGWARECSVAVSPSKIAYVTGLTYSSNFPTTSGAFDTTHQGGGDAFLTGLGPEGMTLAYSTFLGGGVFDRGNGIAVGNAEIAYLCGDTASSDFPTTAGAYDQSYNGGGDAFVAKLDLVTGGFTARRAGARPTIDGNLTEWQGLSQTLLNKNTASSITGSVSNPTLADLSAGLRTAWAPDTLYFAAAMADDVLVGNNSPQIWGDDVIELGIRAGSAAHQFTLALDGRTTDNGNPITSLTYVTRTVPGGWTLEVAIPATALGLAALAANQSYPFTFGLWDDDTRTYPGQTHMIWRGTSTNTYQPEWGTLSLSSTVYDFPQPSTQTPTPTATASLTPTRTPIATATPTQTATATPTATPTVTATATPSPTPTSTATETTTPSATPTASATPTRTQTPTPATGVIAGTVWLDIDGNAAQDSDEPGLSGVTVKLLRDGIQIGQATTAGDGAYRFAALPPGTYVVRELQPDWLRWSTTPDEVTVALAAGETRTVDFGDWSGRRTYLPLILR